MMNKLTAEKCRERIASLKRNRRVFGLALDSEIYLQALEIALPALEQQDHESVIAEQLEAVRDSLALNPHQHAIISCAINRLNNLTRSFLEHREKGNGGWIEWKGGDRPVTEGRQVIVRFRDGFECEDKGLAAWYHDGYQDDIIAYRVIEQQERERGEEG